MMMMMMIMMMMIIIIITIIIMIMAVVVVLMLMMAMMMTIMVPIFCAGAGRYVDEGALVFRLPRRRLVCLCVLACPRTCGEHACV